MSLQTQFLLLSHQPLFFHNSLGWSWLTQCQHQLRGVIAERETHAITLMPQKATLPYWRGQWSSLVLLPETPFSQKKHKATKSLLARKRKLKQFWDNLGEVPFFTWVIWAAYNTKDREVRIFQIIACFPGPGGLKLIGFLFQTCIVLTMLSTHRLGVGAVWLKKDSVKKKSWYFD